MTDGGGADSVGSRSHSRPLKKDCAEIAALLESGTCVKIECRLIALVDEKAHRLRSRQQAAI